MYCLVFPASRASIWATMVSILCRPQPLACLLWKRLVSGHFDSKSKFFFQFYFILFFFSDMSRNALPFIGVHLFETSPKLSEVNLASNSLSRLNDGTFGHLTSLSLLDLSYNSLMRIEDNVFVGKKNRNTVSKI